MRIVFIAPEMAPLAKVGGLADVVGSLPGALRERGHRVQVVLPGYAAAKRAAGRLEPDGPTLRVSLGGIPLEGRALRGEAGGVPVVLLDQPRLFDRNGIYGEGGHDYHDNGQRFGWFCSAALQWIRASDARPEVLHLHDWPTALVAAYLRAGEEDSEERDRPGLLFTIHNLAYQGRFDPALLPVIGLPWSLHHPEGLEFYGQVNLLKGGIVFADVVSTVSPTYAREIQTAEHGAGLEGVLSARSADLFGVLNGLDLDLWDPADDAALAAPFSRDDPSGKRTCKSHLQRRLGLDVSARRPLCGVVGRLDPQKGLDLLAAAAPRLVERGVQLAVLGAGQAEILSGLTRLSGTAPGSIRVTEGFDDRLARRIYAGSDFFLMPRASSPAGSGS